MGQVKDGVSAWRLPPQAPFSLFSANTEEKHFLGIYVL